MWLFLRLYRRLIQLSASHPEPCGCVAEGDLQISRETCEHIWVCAQT